MTPWEVLEAAGFYVKPYVYQCEAEVCLRPSRDLDTDEEPHYHPECEEQEAA